MWAGAGDTRGQGHLVCPCLHTHLRFRLNWDPFHSQVSPGGSQQQDSRAANIDWKGDWNAALILPPGIGRVRPSLEVA